MLWSAHSQGGHGRNDRRCHVCFDWGCVSSSFLFLLQNVVPDLSYTVRCPVLDKWEGIKQLKAALWALVSICNSDITYIECLKNMWCFTICLFFFFFLLGKHRLIKLGSELAAGGGGDHWYSGSGPRLWGSVHQRVGLCFELVKIKKWRRPHELVVATFWA